MRTNQEKTSPQTRKRQAQWLVIPRVRLALLLLAAFTLARIALAAPGATNNAVVLPPQGYTNHAGHVLVGTLVSANSKHATFHLTSGATRTLPLAIFPPAERERIGIASGTLQPPPSVAEALERCHLALRRIDLLVEVGQQSEEAAKKSRDLERQAVRAMLADLEKQHHLTSAAAAYFSARVP